MMGVMCRLCLFVLLCTASLSVTSAATTLVDLNGPGCDNLDGYYIQSADDIVRVFALPQYNTQATRDHCDVTIRADSGRRIQYLIDVIKFHECGIEIYLYDNPTIDQNPMHLITCNDNSKVPIQGKTNYNVLRVRLRKTTPESRVFEFSMGMKNDLGTPLDFDAASAQYAGQALEPGVIAGIAIAGGIIIIALILLAIYLCIRARNATLKEQYGDRSVQAESSVYTSGTSAVIFAPGAQRYPRGKYGSMEDVRSSTSSQEKVNGAYTNSAYTTGPGETRSERQASIGRARGKTGFTNEAYDQDDMGGGGLSWEENEASDLRGSKRISRKDAYDTSDKKPPKSALKKSTNGILKTRAHSPNRSQTSSTDASLDANAMIYGYKNTGKAMPNVRHLPELERRRSRSGTRSHRSGSSTGRSPSSHRRSQSADKKLKNNSRMYTDVFIDDKRNRSSGRRARSDSSRRARSDRTSDSIDSSSSTTSYSRKVSMNPSGKRVHIKGEETDI